jgi:hypothetical protein
MEYRPSSSTSSEPSNTNPSQTITTTTQTTTPRPNLLTDVKSSSLRSLRTSSTESSKSSSRLNRCLVLLSDPTQLEKSSMSSCTTTNKKDENPHAIVKRNDGAIVERTKSTNAIVERRRSHSADALIVRRDSETIGFGSMDDDEALYEYEDMTTHDETYVSSQQRTFNESIDVIVRDADTVGTMGIGSMGCTSMDWRESDSKQRRGEEEEEEMDGMDDKRGKDRFIDTQVITRPLKHRVSSLGRDDPSVEDDDTSAPSTVFEVNKLSFRALANHFRSPTKRISQIDSESCSLFPDAASQKEQDVSGKKIDEIMSKIMKCREKSSRYSTPKSNQTKNASLKNASGAKASAKRPQPKKVPPPPPRRASETPVPVKKQAEKPAPPPRNSPPPRPIQVEAKTSTPNVPSRPPPPVTSTVLTSAMRRHASTGAVPESSRTTMPISPKPPKKDPINHIMSQLQQLEQPPIASNHNHGTRPPIAQDTLQQDLASSLNRRNTTGNAPTKTPGRNDILSGGVSNMAYRDTKGGHGIYSGEVDQWGRPHGEGRIDYDSGAYFEGKWINGEPFQEPSTFQPGFGEMYPQGGGGMMNHPHPAAPMYGGMMQAPYGGGNFNMSMNSFNNSMNFNPMMDPYFRRPG